MRGEVLQRVEVVEQVVYLVCHGGVDVFVGADGCSHDDRALCGDGDVLDPSCVANAVPITRMIDPPMPSGLKSTGGACCCACRPCAGCAYACRAGACCCAGCSPPVLGISKRRPACRMSRACGCTVPAKHICARGSCTVSTDAACPFSNTLRKSVLVTPAVFCLLRPAARS